MGLLTLTYGRNCKFKHYQFSFSRVGKKEGGKAVRKKLGVYMYTQIREMR